MTTGNRSMKTLAATCALVALATLALTTTATADNWRVHGSACQVDDASTNKTYTGVSSSYGTTSGPISYAGTWVIACPIPDMNANKQDIDAVNVHYYRGSNSYGNNVIRACVSYYSANGGACGSSYSGTGSAGQKTAYLNRTGSYDELAAWSSTNAGHFGYVAGLMVYGSAMHGLYMYD